MSTTLNPSTAGADGATCRGPTDEDTTSIIGSIVCLVPLHTRPDSQRYKA